MGGEPDALIEGVIARAATLLKMEPQLCEGLQVLSYLPGQHYWAHTDYLQLPAVRTLRTRGPTPAGPTQLFRAACNIAINRHASGTTAASTAAAATAAKAPSPPPPPPLPQDRWVTVLLYLNDESDGLGGGETTFPLLGVPEEDLQTEIKVRRIVPLLCLLLHLPSPHTTPPVLVPQVQLLHLVSTATADKVILGWRVGWR